MQVKIKHCTQFKLAKKTFASLATAAALTIYHGGLAFEKRKLSEQDIHEGRDIFQKAKLLSQKCSPTSITTVLLLYILG